MLHWHFSGVDGWGFATVMTRERCMPKLCDIVEEIVELYGEDGKALPPSTAGNGKAEGLFVRYVVDSELGSAAVSA